MTTPTAWVGDGNVALLTDLYEFTMCQAYVETGMEDEAAFSLFVRRLPERRNYLLACGLEETLRLLEGLRFSDDDVAYLASTEMFNGRFLDWLRGFRFTGDVHALPEGTPVFANEPLLEITAPIAQAQLVETMVMNQMHMPTVLASKASRVVQAAKGRPVIDFGARRMHGADAALKAARAFHVAGCAGTSNVLAGRLYGLPIMGTMAHSFVQAVADEMEAFRTFTRLYPETVLLVDSFDTLQGVERVVALSKEIEDFVVRGIRIDSGDLGGLARQARQALDENGLEDLKIILSSSLDEDAVDALVSSGVPVDGFGVGTKMGVSDDAPYLDVAYKLCAYAGEGRLKLSPGKPILPGRKQIFRSDNGTHATGDVIGRADETLPGRPLMVPVMQGGRILPGGQADLAAARERAERELAMLGDALLDIRPTPPYPVEISGRLLTDQAEAAQRMGG